MTLILRPKRYGRFCSSSHFTSYNSWCVVGQGNSAGSKEREENLTEHSSFWRHCASMAPHPCFEASVRTSKGPVQSGWNNMVSGDVGASLRSLNSASGAEVHRKGVPSFKNERRCLLRVGMF